MKAMYSVERALIMFCGAFSRFLRIPVCGMLGKKMHRQLYDTEKYNEKH